MEIEFSIAEIDTVAQRIWQEGKNFKVWAFYASMGSGKTTFINALISQLGVEDTVSSPTYSIINEYKSAEVGTVYHMDWYRLKDEEEAINAGVEDALEFGDLVLIEWPEKAEKLLPQVVFEVRIEVVSAFKRKIIWQVVAL